MTGNAQSRYCTNKSLQVCFDKTCRVHKTSTTAPCYALDSLQLSSKTCLAQLSCHRRAARACQILGTHFAVGLLDIVPLS